ncbi:MAG: TldD/PmbA family protein [Clostridia bacterium]|nr:TldD/PmbA family protein [Clostridia bacterium]
MNFELLKEAIIKRAAELGVTDYEIYYESSSKSSAETLGHEISALNSSEAGGICFRCSVDGKMGYASTQLMEITEAEELVERALENGRYTEKDDNVGIFEGSPEYVRPNVNEFKALSPEELKSVALSVQKATYGADRRVVDGTQSQVESISETVRIVNSHGLDLSNSVGINVVFAEAVVEDGGEHQNDYIIKEYGKMSDCELAKTVVEGALSKIGADSVTTGKYNIVFDAVQMRTILGVFTGAFSAKTAQAGMSRLAGKEGEKIAADFVNITDDPMRDGTPMQAYFDAEGVAAFRKDVVRDGVLVTLLHNRETASKAGCVTTGNASKVSYSSPIDVKPHTFCIEAGDYSEDELLKLADHGIYINEVKGLHAGANPVTGDFSIESAGFLIENGIKTVPVKSFTVAGNFFELLRDISALSDKVDIGFSGIGAPAVLVKNMSVAGK